LITSAYKLKQCKEHWQDKFVPQTFASLRFTKHSISSFDTASRILRKHVFPSCIAEELCTATFVNIGMCAAVQRRCTQYTNTDTGLWDIQMHPVIQLL
jgi:hypothetical protein